MINKLIDKFKSLPLPMRAAFFFVFCGVFKDVVDVLVTPFFTRILTVEEYGLFNVYNSWYQIFRIIVSLSIYSEGFNVGMARFGDDKEGFTSSQQGLMTVMFIVWGSVFFLWKDTWNEMLGLNSVLMMFMLFQIMFWVQYHFWYQKTKYTYKYKILTVITLCYTLLQPFLGILLIKLNTYGINNGELRIYASVGVQIIFGVICYSIQFIKNHTFFNKQYWIFALKTNIVLLPHFLSQILLNHTDKIMINMFSGKAQTAIYSVAHSAAFVVLVIITNLNSSFVPWLYERMKKKNYVGIKSIISSLVIIAATSILLIVVVAPEAMFILADEQYHEGIWVVPPLAYSVFFIFIYTLLANFELFYSKNHFVMIASLVGVGINVLLNYFLIPVFGFVAAGYTTLAGYFVICVLHIVFIVLTFKKEKLPMKEIVDLKVLALVTLVLAVLCASVMLLYNTIVIRYILVAIILLIAVIKRKLLLSLFKNLKVKQV